MAPKSEIEEEIISMEEGVNPTIGLQHCCSSNNVVTMAQKVIAEVIGTYFVIFAGCGSVTVNKIYGSVTFPGILYHMGSHCNGHDFLCCSLQSCSYHHFRRLRFKELISLFMSHYLFSVWCIMHRTKDLTRVKTEFLFM
ncbi:putative aquaporin [Lupinus albus]|uniref:Putative aquaporin n=1 Tax=Lupinus albus TaxID=3870 RepID=A0A6A4QN61_LUPAL|nr:putative aquaporin [Lupinus albus]